MIGGLQVWIKQLVLVVLLAALAEMLLPQSGLRRYARAAVGLLVLLAVLVPFLSLVRGGLDWEAAFRPLPEAPPSAEVAAGVRRLEEVNRGLVLAAYRRKVEEAVAAVATGVEGVAAAAAQAEVDGDPRSPRFGTVRSVTVTVTPAAPAPLAEGPPRPGAARPGPAPDEAGRLREAVAGAIAREFGWERSRVRVVVGGDGR